MPSVCKRSTRLCQMQFLMVPLPADRAGPEVQGAACGGGGSVRCTAGDVVAQRHRAALQGGASELHASPRRVLCSQHPESCACRLERVCCHALMRSELAVMHLTMYACFALSWVTQRNGWGY